MISFPPFYPPYYKGYYNNANNVKQNPLLPNKGTVSSNNKDLNFDKKQENSSENYTSEKDSDNKNCDDVCNEYFEIFGLKLYFDDILLICMIFFLYNEGVQDQMLFISLILLLLS